MMPSDQDPTEQERQDRAARRRRALELMGELEPRVTRDETGEGWGERTGGSRDDELRRDVPPHHGG